jgi:hypothetical protein
MRIVTKANEKKRTQDNASPEDDDQDTGCPNCKNEDLKFVPLKHTLAINMIGNLRENHSCVSIMDQFDN